MPDEDDSDGRSAPPVLAGGEVIALLARSGADDGPLDARTRRLVRLALAVGSQSDAEIGRAAVEALAQGCDPAEIEQVVLLGFETVGWLTGLDTLKLVRDSLKD